MTNTVQAKKKTFYKISPTSAVSIFCSVTLKWTLQETETVDFKKNYIIFYFFTHAQSINCFHKEKKEWFPRQFSGITYDFGFSHAVPVKKNTVYKAMCIWFLIMHWHFYHSYTTFPSPFSCIFAPKDVWRRSLLAIRPPLPALVTVFVIVGEQ